MGRDMRPGTCPCLSIPLSCTHGVWGTQLPVVPWWSTSLTPPLLYLCVVGWWIGDATSCVHPTTTLPLQHDTQLVTETCYG